MTPTVLPSSAPSCLISATPPLFCSQVRQEELAMEQRRNQLPFTFIKPEMKKYIFILSCLTLQTMQRGF